MNVSSVISIGSSSSSSLWAVPTTPMLPVETPPTPINPSAWTRMYVPGRTSSESEKVSAITDTSACVRLRPQVQLASRSSDLGRVQVFGDLQNDALGFLRPLEKLIENL